MTSQAQAETPMTGVHGLAFVGFPLHAAKKPSIERAAHLGAIHIPMLFVQGNRDALADLTLLEPVIAELGDRAVLHMIEGADHSLHVPARTGRTDRDVLGSIAGTMAQWMKGATRGLVGDAGIEPATPPV